MAAPSFHSVVVRLAVRAPAGALTLRVVGPLVKAQPVLARGPAKFAGEVDRITTPTAGLLVRVYERVSGRLVRETRSSAGGLYEVANLHDAAHYYLVAFDDQPGGQNAAIADWQQPS